MPYCYQFKNQIEKLAENIKQAKNMLEEYLKTGDPILAETIKQMNLVEQKNAFKKEFREKVLEVLKEWYPMKHESFIKSFLKNCYFDDDLRVIFKENQEDILETAGILMLTKVELRKESGDREEALNYFPAIIKKIETACSIGDHNITNFDYLEEVGGNLFLDNTPFQSALRLKKIGGFLNLENANKISSFSNAFPQLKKIGADGRLGTNLEVSLYLYGNEHLIPEIENLIDQDKIDMDSCYYTSEY